MNTKNSRTENMTLSLLGRRNDEFFYNTVSFLKRRYDQMVWQLKQNEATMLMAKAFLKNTNSGNHEQEYKMRPVVIQMLKNARKEHNDLVRKVQDVKIMYTRHLIKYQRTVQLIKNVENDFGIVWDATRKDTHTKIDRQDYIKIDRWDYIHHEKFEYKIISEVYGAMDGFHAMIIKHLPEGDREWKI